MSVSVEIKTTVRGGLPLVAEAHFTAYDHDDLELDTLELYTLRGKSADWAKPTADDLARIERECREALTAKAEADAESYAEMRAEDKRWYDY